MSPTDERSQRRIELELWATRPLMEDLVRVASPIGRGDRLELEKVPRAEMSALAHQHFPTLGLCLQSRSGAQGIAQWREGDSQVLFNAVNDDWAGVKSRLKP